MDSQISSEFAFVCAVLLFSLFVHTAPRTSGNYYLVKNLQLKIQLGVFMCVGGTKNMLGFFEIPVTGNLGLE